MKKEFRCDCPITTALDILGDKWILVIVKQMLVEKAQTFKEFTESDEGIATNILSSKLKCLEAYKFIERKAHPTNQKVKLYHLTEKGLTLTPIIVEMARWSDQHLRQLNPSMRNGKELELLRTDKEAFINSLKKSYRNEVLQQGV